MINEHSNTNFVHRTAFHDRHICRKVFVETLSTNVFENVLTNVFENVLTNVFENVLATGIIDVRDYVTGIGNVRAAS